MTLRSSKPLLALLVALSLAACGDKPSSESAGTEGASSPTVSTAEAFLLKADLPEAIDIYDVRKKSVGELLALEVDIGLAHGALSFSR